MASIVLSTPGWETLSCSAIAIIAAPTMRTSTQERWYSPHWTKVALGSAKMNFPAMKRARIYKKPGVYLSGPLFGIPWRYAAVAELATAPSALLASVLDIDFPCLSGAACNFQRCRKCTIPAGKLSHSFKPISEKGGRDGRARTRGARGAGPSPRRAIRLASDDVQVGCGYALLHGRPAGPLPYRPTRITRGHTAAAVPDIAACRQ